MKALDTNILARYYVDDPGDPEAAKQRPLARQIILGGSRLFVPLTVLLELEWVLRAFYGFEPGAFTGVVHHLLGMSNISVEQWPRVVDALEVHEQGLDFSDALHLMGSAHCEAMYSFDDQKFARRVKRLGIKPEVIVPADH